MGPVWSMTPSGAGCAAGSADALAPARLDVATAIGGVKVDASRLRLRVPGGLRRAELRDHGLAGAL